MAPTTAIFDLGNVLIRWDRRNLYKNLFPDTDAGRAAMDHFLDDVVGLHTFNRRIDLGADIAELCEEFVARHPDVDPALIRAYDTRKTEMFDGIIEETAAMVRALRARGVRCYALSNWGRDIAVADELFPALGEFDGRVISHEVGLVKPDEAIFTHVLQKFDLRAEDCFFVDDNADNIAAAKALGFATHRFTSPIALRSRLDRDGLLPLDVPATWTSTTTSLQRTLSFDDFAEAWSFMEKVADAADALDHHPDWSNSWNKVDITLTSHDTGAVTSRDRALAEFIDTAVRAVVAPRADALASAFADDLVRGDFAAARARLRPETLSVDELRETWQAMSTDGDPFTETTVEAALSDWPDREADQLRWTYVSTIASTHVEAVIVTTATPVDAPSRLDRLLIDSIRFGRP